MTHASSVSQKAKISPEFVARLGRLGPAHKVRAIVLLRTEGVKTPTGRRQSRVERRVATKSIRESDGQALTDIDSVLERYDGRRLADGPDALGSIAVETTAAGITALAASDHIKAILEDQPISLVGRPKHPQ